MLPSRHGGIPRSTILLAAAASLAAGCVGQRAYETGLRQLNAGDFDKAVQSLRDAHHEAPEKQDFFDAWCHATEQAVTWHQDQAAEQFNRRELRSAHEHLVEALHYCDLQGESIPGRPTKRCPTACGLSAGPPHAAHGLRGAIDVNVAELRELRELVERAISSAEERTAVGEAHLCRGDWDAAVLALREAADLDRSSQRATALLREAVAGAVSHHLTLARQHLATEAWDACRGECAIVLSYRPGNDEAERLLSLTDERRRARALQERATRLAVEDEYLSAIDTLEQAERLWGADPSIADTLRETKREAADALRREADACADRGAFRGALDLLDRAAALAPARTNLESVMARVEARWADALLDEAKRLFERGENELAWVQALLAAGISDVHLAARRAMDVYAATVREELRCAIAILPVSPDGSSSREAVRACAMMAGALGAMAPPHLRIVERSNLRDLLAEQHLARVDRLDPEALHTLSARLRDADLLLFVSTSRRSADARALERQQQIARVVGTRLARNPAYADAQAQVEAAHRDLDRVLASQRRRGFVRRLAAGFHHAGGRIVEITVGGDGGSSLRVAERQLRQAAHRLRSTPEFIEVPNEQVLAYPVYRVTRQATVTAEMRLVDVATGEIVWSEAGLSHTVSRSDTSIEPQPEFGVPGKRALLPDPEQLYPEAVEGLAFQVEQAARAFLSRRAEAYLARARRAASPDKTAALYVHYLFDPGPDPASTSVDEALAALCHIDLDPARQRRCRQFARARLALKVAPPVARLAVRPPPEPPAPVPAPAPARETLSLPRVRVARSAPEPQSVYLVLFDKRKRDKARAFGLVFDVDDVTHDGVDVRVSTPGTKGPKFEDLRTGREFVAHHVRGRVIELDPKDERAVIEVVALYHAKDF
jgi:tetratricopeptide (TPR) repeat protein